MIELAKVDWVNTDIPGLELSQKVDARYLDIRTLDLLKQFFEGRNIQIIVEYPYYDKDYLSTYYLFYCKKQGYYPKSCYRLHIYEERNEQKVYRGSIVLRPTKGSTNIGKTYIDPCLFLTEGYLLVNRFVNSVLGDEIEIEAFPWMKQETDITVCAHVALWSVIRYYGAKYPNYQDVSMGEIVMKTPERNQRKIPLSDLSMSQIPETLKKQGFSPIVIRRGTEHTMFEEQLFAYIESGIPLIGCLTEKRHSVAVIGHGKIDYAKLDEYDSLDKSFGKDNIVLSGSLLNNIIVNDDAIGPYLNIDREINVFDSAIYEGWTHSRPYSIADFDYLIVPLYDRMQYNYSALMQAVTIFLRQNRIKLQNNLSQEFDFLNSNEKYVARIYISSAKSLKHQMSKILNNNDDLRYFIKHIELPKFVWNVDFSTISEYKKGMVSAKILVDTTCCNIDRQPWLLIHNSEYIWIMEQNVQDAHWKIVHTKVEPYVMYKNNLKSVKELS